MVFLILIILFCFKTSFHVSKKKWIKSINDSSKDFLTNNIYIKEECYNNNVYTNRIEISSNVCIINSIFRSIGDSSTSGGAVYISINNLNENQNIIQNTSFTNCFSNKGGAIYISSQYNINIKCENCTFINNAVSINNAFGGAIYIDSIDNILLNECNFITNSVSSEYQDGKSAGGSIYSHMSILILNSCIFNDNRALTTETETICDGGTVSLFSSEGNFSGCLFDNNYCSKIISNGCVSIHESVCVNFNQCNFTNNKANSYMNIGTVYMYDSNVTFKTCNFVNNTYSVEGEYSQVGGGAVYISEAKASFDNCIFQNNSVYASGIDSFSGGGAITSSLGNFSIRNCHFIDNIASEGEMLYIVEKSDSNLKIDYNIFERNINTMSQMKSLIYLDFDDQLENINSFTNNKVFLFNTDRIRLFDCYEDNSIQRKWIFNENCLYPFDQQYFKSDTLILYDETGQNIIDFINAFQQECSIQTPEQSSDGGNDYISSESTLTSIQSEINLETLTNEYEETKYTNVIQSDDFFSSNSIDDIENSDLSNSIVESNYNNMTSNTSTLISTQEKINKKSYSFSISYSLTFYLLRSVSYSFSYSFGNIFSMDFSDGEFYTTILTKSITLYNFPYIIFYLSPSYVPSYISFFIRKPKITGEQLIGIVCGTTATIFFILFVIIRVTMKTNNNMDYLKLFISDEMNKEEENGNGNGNNKGLTPIIKNNDDLDSSNDYDVDFWL